MLMKKQNIHKLIYATVYRQWKIWVEFSHMRIHTYIQFTVNKKGISTLEDLYAVKFFLFLFFLISVYLHRIKI